MKTLGRGAGVCASAMAGITVATRAIAAAPKHERDTNRRTDAPVTPPPFPCSRCKIRHGGPGSLVRVLRGSNGYRPAMPLRVIEWSTGHVGIHALRGIIRHPDLELVGLWVHSPDKAGRDAGDLCDLPPTGVLATN